MIRTHAQALPGCDHPKEPRDFWPPLVNEALSAGTPTPFYLLSAEPLREALAEMTAVQRSVPIPVRHWLSCKTQPVAPLLRWWRRQGRPVEVVSEFEFLAARHEGFAPDQILVNGPAKHHWLARHACRRLWVNFDSPREMAALLPLAKSLDWGVGIRCHSSAEFDPENPGCPTQFGFLPNEAVAALRKLRRAGVRLETVHFHLRTNVATPASYERALTEVAELCSTAGFKPKYLDCGGGWPPARVLSRDGAPVNAGFDLLVLGQVYARAVKRFPGLRELWLENGRFVSARAGILVIRVLDIKERAGVRYLICDGGRTTQALVSTWEQHGILTVPTRRGPMRTTTVCGPTCMAFDQLARCPLPASIRPGDYLLWLDAGAYHIPWETRFSHGHATVLWHEHGKLRVVRRRESFAQWWGGWR